MAESKGAAQNVIHIRGKVLLSEKKNGTQGTWFRTLVKCAAPDEFTPGDTFELRSHRDLGQVGAVIEAQATLKGYANTYTPEEGPNAGKTVKSAQHVLSVA